MSAPVPDEPGALRRVRLAARLMDDAVRVPIVGTRIGIDPLLSIVPGGSVLGVALSLYVVVEAALYGVPRRVLARMLVNVGIDGLAGLVPLLGPIVDATYRANRRNLRLFERAVADRQAAEEFVAIEIE